MFRGLADMANLLRNAQDLQSRAGEMRERLAAVRVEGTAGGGMVTVTASGEQKIVRVQIEPSLIESGDTDMVESLIESACNQALEQAKKAAAEEMSQLADGMGIPGIQEALSRFGLSDGNPTP